MNQYPNIAIGDLISRPKGLGLVEHFGVVVAPDLVLQNTPERGEHVTSVIGFAADQRIRRLSTSADPASVVARARAILSRPRKYNLFNRNCEHTAREAAHGKAESWIINILLLLTVGVVLWVLVRK